MNEKIKNVTLGEYTERLAHMYRCLKKDGMILFDGKEIMNKDDLTQAVQDGFMLNVITEAQRLAETKA